MEDDLFQGDFQDYLENGDLYKRCSFQWYLIQSIIMEKHILLEMKFPQDQSSEDYMSSDYSKQTTKILERAVNAVIKGSLIKSICFTQSTTIEDVKTIIDQVNHGKCSILIAYNLDIAASVVQSFFFNNVLNVQHERLFCCIVAVQYAVYPYPCAEGRVVLTYPAVANPIYLNAFHVSIPLIISDTSKFSLWSVLGLVENQAKLTEDLHNGLSCEKIEEELKRSLYYRISVDELRDIKINISKIHMSLEIKQRIVEIITSTRQNPSVASFCPINSVSYLIMTVCLSALLDGRTFVLPHHIETVVPILATHIRMLYHKGSGMMNQCIDVQIDSRRKIAQSILDAFPALILIVWLYETSLNYIT